MRHYDKADIFRGDIAAGKSLRLLSASAEPHPCPVFIIFRPNFTDGPVFVQQRHDVTNRSDRNKIQNFRKAPISEVLLSFGSAVPS